MTYTDLIRNKCDTQESKQWQKAKSLDWDGCGLAIF
jgi:hypothetical protein